MWALPSEQHPGPWRIIAIGLLLIVTLRLRPRGLLPERKFSFNAN